MNAFEDAIERGEIDLGEYAEPYTDYRYLTAWCALPENDDSVYVALRDLLYCGDGLSNEHGRRNNQKIVKLIMASIDLRARFETVRQCYPETSMLGQLHHLADSVRGIYLMIVMMRNAPPPVQKTPEQLEDERFWDRFKKHRRDRNDYDDTDDLNAPWGFIPGRPAA